MNKVLYLWEAAYDKAIHPQIFTQSFTLSRIWAKVVDPGGVKLVWHFNIQIGYTFYVYRK